MNHNERGAYMRVRRIEQRLRKFVESRNTSFTINDVMGKVKWDGSAKHLARFLIKDRIVKVIGKRRVDGKLLNVYARSDLNIYGQE